MPRVSGREAHILYSPKQRQAEFPNADWRFLVWTARNVAAAVATVHSNGHVIGDINQKGFLVSADATVRLIDCDSFQVVAAGKKYLCVVGVPEFTPPELHGQPFGRVERTPNHDAFGLAVLVFQLLFMGRHPFAGRFLGRGDLPIERAIREFRFAYSQSASTKEILPPPHSLALSSVSFSVASLFERAFSAAGAHGNRPTAHDWTAALEKLSNELKSCDADRAHRFHSSLSGCAWCAIERVGGPSFFISASAGIQANVASGFDFAATWNAIRNVRHPTVYAASSPIVGVTVVANKLPRDLILRRRIAQVCIGVGLLAVALGLGGALGDWAYFLATASVVSWLALRSSGEWAKERSRRKTELDSTQRHHSMLIENLRRESQQFLDAFTQRRRVLDQLAAEYKAQPQKLQQERDTLNRRREELQRKAFLERYYVRDAKFDGIGTGLKNVLISYGVETAFDIGHWIQVPGIGPTRLSALLAWRAQIEQRFRFDPSQDVNPADVAALNHKFALRRKEIERLLAQGRLELDQLSRRADHLHVSASEKLKIAARYLAQASADYQLSK